MDAHNRLTVNTATKIVTKILHIAVKKRWMTITKLLIHNGADPDAKDNDGSTALHIAVAKESTKDIVSLLLNSGASVDAKGKHAITPLHIAAMNGNIRHVENLLNNGAYINEIDIFGRTALHFTAISANECARYYHKNKNFNSKIRGQTANMLLCKGANINARNILSLTTLHAAADKGYPEVVEALLAYNANINCTTTTPDQQWVIERARSQFPWILDGYTPLHCATANGNEEIVTMLLNKGANVNASQKYGPTSLHIACRAGHKKLVKILLEYGANVDSEGMHRHTPLHVAAQEGKMEIIRTLLKYGAKIDSRDPNGTTPLFLAARYEHYDAFLILLEYGADINSTSSSLHQVTNSLIHPSPGAPVARALVRHIVAMKNANLYLREEILSLSRDRVIKPFWAQCENEIANMKSERINNSSISFFSILSKTTHSLAIYTMRNEDIVQHLESVVYEKKFPIYGVVLRYRFKKSIQRKKLLEQGNKILNVFFKNVRELPYECNEEILRHLSEDDLQNLMETFKQLNI